MSELEQWVPRGIVDGAVRHFGSPPLLVEAAEVIFERVTTGHRIEESVFTKQELKANVSFDNFFGEKDGPSYKRIVTDATPNGPSVHIGFVENEPLDAVCLWTETNQWPGTDRSIIQQTTVVFYGRKTRIQEQYVGLRGGQLLAYPPAGVYVDFTCFEGSETQARIFGTVGSNGADRPWVMQGITRDKAIFDAGAHIPLESQFGFQMDTTGLLPVARTLSPQFFLNDIPLGLR